MSLRAYEKLINDMYQYLLQNKIENQTSMVDFSKQFCNDKVYQQDFLLEMNTGHAPEFLNMLKDMIMVAKKSWNKSPL